MACQLYDFHKSMLSGSELLSASQLSWVLKQFITSNEAGHHDNVIAIESDVDHQQVVTALRSNKAYDLYVDKAVLKSHQTEGNVHSFLSLLQNIVWVWWQLFRIQVILRALKRAQDYVAATRMLLLVYFANTVINAFIDTIAIMNETHDIDYEADGDHFNGAPSV